VTIVACAQDLPKADQHGPKQSSILSEQKKEVTHASSSHIDIISDTKGFNLSLYINEKVAPEIKRQAGRCPVFLVLW